jgi:hypothetical protein
MTATERLSFSHYGTSEILPDLLIEVKFEAQAFLKTFIHSLARSFRLQILSNLDDTICFETG